MARSVAAADESDNWRVRKAPSSTNDNASTTLRLTTASSDNGTTQPPHPYGRVKEQEISPRTDQPVAPAIAEGRRIYIGSLQYFITPADLDKLLEPYTV